MMSEVAKHGFRDHHVPGILTRDMSSHHESPVGQQMFIVCPLQCFAGLLYRSIER